MNAILYCWLSCEIYSAKWQVDKIFWTFFRMWLIWQTFYVRYLCARIERTLSDCLKMNSFVSSDMFEYLVKFKNFHVNSWFFVHLFLIYWIYFKFTLEKVMWSIFWIESSKLIIWNNFSLNWLELNSSQFLVTILFPL